MPPATPIYLDHHATTPVDPRVLDAMLPFFSEDFGNAASAAHVYGWRAEAAAEDARARIAAALRAEPSEVVFTSGATESNNLAILGVARARRKRGDHVVTVATEHPSVLDPVAQLGREGLRVTVLDVDGEGFVDPDAVREAIGPQTLLVSVGAANGEIGTLQPLAEIAAVCREGGTLLHSDAAQAIGRVDLPLDEIDVDLLSISAHKMYGPKGIGALFIRSRKPRIRPQPLVFGGGQEGGLRSGTLAVPLVVGMATALELCQAELGAESKRLADLRDRLWRSLSASEEGAVLNGPIERRLPGNLNVSFPGIDGERLLVGLHDVALSTGSACASAHSEPSHVLRALGRSDTLARASLRFGLGRGTSSDDIERVAARVVEELPDARISGSEARAG